MQTNLVESNVDCRRKVEPFVITFLSTPSAGNRTDDCSRASDIIILENKGKGKKDRRRRRRKIKLPGTRLFCRYLLIGIPQPEVSKVKKKKKSCINPISSYTLFYWTNGKYQLSMLFILKYFILQPVRNLYSISNLLK